VRAALLILALSVLVAAGCGGSHSARPKLESARPALAKRLLTEQLHAKQLDYTWVACVRVGRSYEHVPITRCNVDFGIDPHVEGYCVLLKNGRLATNHQDPAIPCKHDDAGWDRTTITS
jgi:hypothetical protein